MRVSKVLLYQTLPLGYGVGYASASILPYAANHSAVEHVARQSATIGSCISAPQAACASLVGLCVSEVLGGQVPANNFWTSPICFTAATCAGVAPLVDAICCAGTCSSITAMTSLDYDNVYAPTAGSCAFQPNGCPVTWIDFVNYFYNTIQGTGTGDFPLSGDDVLAWWSSIATWTGFCSGTLCVDGQIPYLNLNDWLHFSWATIVSQPGNPPIRDPPSNDRDDNTDDWDPHYDSACPFTDAALCMDDNSPQEPPDNTATAAIQVPAARKIQTGSGSVQINLNQSALSPANVNLSNPFPFGKTPFQPVNIPPIFINNGTTPVPLNLTLGSPTATSSNGTVQSQTMTAKCTVMGDSAILDIGPFKVLPVIRSDQCKGSIDTPNPLPALTYYCDYMPNICSNIRDSGFLTNDQVILTYDPFNTGSRRRGVCTPAQKAMFQKAGGCDPRQHNPAYWKVSCDEFPFNSTLEGGLANGAVVQAVPEIEQSFQSTLQTSISSLLRVRNEARSQWKKPGSLNSQFPGMCHKYLLSLTDTRPVTADPHAVGTLDTGGAWLTGEQQGFVKELTNSRAVSPSDPLPSDTPYGDNDVALQPSRSYKPFDCSPCSDDDSDSDVASTADGAIVDEVENAVPPTITSPTIAKRQASPSSCTIRPTATPLPTDPTDAQADSESQASSAAAAAAAAAAALAASNALSASEQAAAATATAAAAAALMSAVLSNLAAANAPADIAAALDSATSVLDDAQSILSSFTSIFHFGDPSSPPPPDSINTLGDSISSSISSAANAVTDKWNMKPPTEAPVPPYIDPALDPNVNNVKSPLNILNPGSVPGSSFPAAACFGAGSQGFLKIGDVFITNENGNAPATLADAGSDAFFGLEIPTPRSVSAVCPGVYQWTGDTPGPFWQVNCNTNEFGTFWNGVQQSCYTYFKTPDSGVFATFCGNNLGNIYSCIQAAGLFNTLTPDFFTWVAN